MAKFLTKNPLFLQLVYLRRIKMALMFLFLGFCVQSSLMAQPNVYFEIRNDSVFNGTHYHFDVYMYADQGGTYHNKGQIYVLYDTAALGEAVVFNNRVTNCPTGNSANPTCIGLHLDLLSETNILGPKYRTTLNDNGNRLAATWISNFENVCPPNGFSHTVVPDTATSLYHFEVLMSNPAIDPKLDFYFPLMVNQQFFSNPTPPASGVDCDQPYGNGGLLPVELAYFDANKLDKEQVALTWLTTNERHHSHFVVEKKRGQGEFQALSWIMGQGHSDEDLNYSYTDRTAMSEVNYYRLKIVDIDGNASYSQTVEVRYDELAESFAVYPIPAQDFLMIEPLISLENQGMTYQIINPQGQILSTGSISDQSPLRISTSELTSGIYYIRILGKNSISFQKQFAKK